MREMRMRLLPVAKLKAIAEILYSDLFSNIDKFKLNSIELKYIAKLLIQKLEDNAEVEAPRVQDFPGHYLG